MSAADSYQVEIGWQGSTTGLFKIGTSLLGSVDTFGSNLPGGFVAADDMTARVVALGWSRGRESNLGEMAMGAATITCTDPSQELNPNNPTGPFVGLLEVKRPVRIRAAHPAIFDDFSTNTIADYTFDEGAGTLAVSGGQLVPSSTALKRLYHSARGYQYEDAQVTLKVTLGASDESGVGPMLRFSASSQVVARIDSLGERLDLDAFDPSHRNLLNGAYNFLANTTYWLRLRKEGNLLVAEAFTSEPTLTGTPAVTVTHTLTGADATAFGVGVSAHAGLFLPPIGTDERYDDFRAEAYPSFPLFYGFVRAIEPKPDLSEKQTLIHCVDLFYFLNRARPIISQITSTTTGAAIGEVLDAIGWTDVAFRSLDIGDALAAWPHADMPADGTRTGLQLISELLEAELGIFYIDGAGVATYVDRHTLHSAGSPEHDLSDVFRHTESGPELELIRNRARVTRTGGVQQTSVNQDSIDLYGESDFPALETPYLATDNAAASLASHLVFHHGKPLPPVWTLELDATAGQAVLNALVDADVGHHVRVTEEFSGVGGLYHIESLKGGLRYREHVGSWTLSKEPDMEPFRIGVSTIGGPHVIEY